MLGGEWERAEQEGWANKGLCIGDMWISKGCRWRRIDMAV